MFVDVYVYVLPLRSVVVTTEPDELVERPCEGVYVWVLPFKSVVVTGPTEEGLPVGWMLVDV